MAAGGFGFWKLEQGQTSNERICIWISMYRQIFIYGNTLYFFMFSIGTVRVGRRK